MPDSRMNLDKDSKEYDLISSALRDAHAMEEQALTLLNTQVKRLQNYPELRDRVEQHIEETRGQQRRIDECLEAIGSDRSMLKDIAMKFTVSLGGLFNAMTEDEILKSSFMSYSFENFEIACYRGLQIMADKLGLAEIARIATENLKEEQAMAEWLEQHLPVVTSRYVELALAGREAKR